MNDLVNQFTQGPAAQKQFNRLSDKSNRGGAVKRKTSKSQERRGQRSNSKERRITTNDLISQEVERKLKQQRKYEKERIKQYGQIYGGDFSTGNGGISL